MAAGITITVTTREGEHNSLTTRPGQQTLMQLLFDEDQGIEAACGGCASCATCHVFVSDDWVALLPERDGVENMLLEYQENFDPHRSRLSCQVQLTAGMDGLSLTVAPEE